MIFSKNYQKKSLNSHKNLIKNRKNPPKTTAELRMNQKNAKILLKTTKKRKDNRSDSLKTHHKRLKKYKFSSNQQ